MCTYMSVSPANYYEISQVTWEKQFLEKSAFLDIFLKLSSIQKAKPNSIQMMFQ